MRPFNLGNNLMFNDMTMGLGLNPFSSDSMLAVGFSCSLYSSAINCRVSGSGSELG